MAQWDYYDKFENLIDEYMESTGEGNTKASQIVTSVNKLVYMYYNNGDVYDNTNFEHYCLNDVSDYANWLYDNTTDTIKNILTKVKDISCEVEYELILKQLADTLLDESYLEEQSKIQKVGSIYKCCGKFKYIEDEEDDEWY